MRQLFIVSGPPKILYSQKSWSRILFGSAHHSKLLCTKVINTTVLEYRPPRCCSYSQNHASDTGGGWAFQIVALTHKNNRDNFFHRIRAPEILRVLTKSWQILFGSAQLLLILTKLSIPVLISAHRQVVARTHKSYQYNCFLEYQKAHLQGCCSRTHKKSCIRHQAADGPAFRLLLLHTRISDNFFIVSGHPSLRVLTKSWSKIFIRISPQFVARTHKVINTTVLEYRPTSRCCSYSNHASDTGGGWARLSDCSYTQNNQVNFFHRIRPPNNLRVLTKSDRILFGSAHRQVVARTHKSYQYNCFFGYQPPQVLLVLTKSRHRRMVRFQIVALTQN
jgi:hypothetical protein